MVQKRPLVSVIICTYNAGNLLEQVLSSISSQTLQNYEILCVDGGSKDKTLDKIQELSKKDQRIKLIHNPQKLPEGKGKGKWLGTKLAKGKYLAFIDQDNQLQRTDFLEISASLLSKEKTACGVLAGVKSDPTKSSVSRFVGMFGTDAFFAYRSVDFLRHALAKTYSEGVSQIQLNPNFLYLTGGNCFVYRKSDISSIGGFEQDIISIQKIVNKNKSLLLIASDATIHYADRNFLRFISKKFFWSQVFAVNKPTKFNYLPSNSLELHQFILNLFSNLLILPRIPLAIKFAIKFKDSVALLLPAMAFLTTVAYGLSFVRFKLSQK